MTTTIENGQLFAQLTGQPKFPIFAKGKNTFEWRVVKAEVEFIKDDKVCHEGSAHTERQYFRSPQEVMSFTHRQT